MLIIIIIIIICSMLNFVVLLQAYHKLAKEFHPDKNPAAGDKVDIFIFLA